MVSPKTAQKPCTTDAQILHPTSCLHGDNRFASSGSFALSFRVKHRADPEPSVNVSPDPGSSPE